MGERLIADCPELLVDLHRPATVGAARRTRESRDRGVGSSIDRQVHVQNGRAVALATITLARCKPARTCWLCGFL